MAFCTDDPNLLDDWLTVGAAAQLQGRTPSQALETSLLGEALRLWRADDGALVCHSAVGGLTVREHCGYLWVLCRGPARKPLFALPEYAEPGRRRVDCGGIGVATSGLRVIENFLDMGHFPYVHTGTLGKVPHTEVLPYKVKVDAALDEILATDCQFYQPRTSATAQQGVQAQYRYRVMQPFCAALYKSSPALPGGQDVIVLMVQPLDDERVIAHCLLIYHDDGMADTGMIAFQQMIFGEDKPLLESQRPRRLPLEGPLEAHMRCDLTSTTYRRWLKARGMRFGVHQDLRA